MIDILGLGTITKVNEDFSIEFRIPGVAENCKGYPMSAEDQPEKDQTIVWMRVDYKALGETFIYKKLNIGYDNPIELKVDNYRIRINKNEGIRIDNDTANGASLVLKDGKITINSGTNNGAVNISEVNKAINWINSIAGVFSSATATTDAELITFIASLKAASAAGVLPSTGLSEDTNFTH